MNSGKLVRVTEKNLHDVEAKGIPALCSKSVARIMELNLKPFEELINDLGQASSMAIDSAKKI